MIDLQRKQLETRIQIADEKAVKIKANITLVEQGLRELMHLPLL